MKRTNSFELWTNPSSALSEGYRHLSYVLFRTDHEDGEILGARCPDVIRMATGGSFPEKGGLCEEARCFLRDDSQAASESSSRSELLWISTDMGVGLLDKSFDRDVGLAIYWHIHGRPASLARLVCHGVLGDPEGEMCSVSEAVRQLADGDEVSAGDMPSYKALSDAWNGRMACLSANHLSPDQDGRLYREDLCQYVKDLAAFVGCGFRVEEGNEPTRLKCYRPRLMEALLFCLLTEVRTASATRDAICRISASEGVEDGNLILTLRYPVEDSAVEGDIGQSRERVHRHLGWVSELGGLELHTSLRRPNRSERSRGVLPEVTVTLEWLTNPAVLSTTDLKAQIRFLYQEESDHS